MNPFQWLTRKVKDACAEGLRQFFADIHPDAPPQSMDELRALVAAPPPALPATDAEPEPVGKPRGKK